MALFSKLRNEFIDTIEFLDSSHNTIVYRFERHNNEIKNNAKLIVREGQIAVFVDGGKIADTFEPGTHTLVTENLPILSTLKGWKYGFNSPFKAEVYFVSTKNFIDQKWGTKNPVTLSDSRFGMIELRAFGLYSFKVIDPTTFIKEIVGTNQSFTTQDIENQLKSIIVTRFTDAVGEAHLPVEQYAANLNELSESLFECMGTDFGAYGMQVTKFLIENISMPDAIKSEIFELSRLEKIDLEQYTKLKTAKAMEVAASNESGVAGMGVGLGAGMAMANQMTQTVKASQQAQNQQTAATTPPPLPQDVAYYFAINGQQAGPYNLQKIKELASQQQITGRTLVWTQGMTDWESADKQSDLQGIFIQTPPPIPQQ